MADKQITLKLHMKFSRSFRVHVKYVKELCTTVIKKNYKALISDIFNTLLRNLKN